MVGDQGMELPILYNFGHVASSNKHDLINLINSGSLVLSCLLPVIYFAVIVWHRVTGRAIETSA